MYSIRILLLKIVSFQFPTVGNFAGSAVRVVVPERIRQYHTGGYQTEKPVYNPSLKVLKSPEKLFQKFFW